MMPLWFEHDTESHITDIDVLQTDVLVSFSGAPVGTETQLAYYEITPQTLVCM